MSVVELHSNISDAGDGSFFQFFDVTGVRNLEYNMGGYGTPNFRVSDADWADVQLQKLDDSTVYTIDLYPNMPSAARDFSVLIYNTQIGLTTDQKIEDIYLVTYRVGHLDSSCAKVVDAVESKYVAIIPKIKCCLKNIRQGLPVPPSKDACCEASEQVLQLAIAEQTLTTLCNLVECSQIERAKEDLAWLKKYCNCNI